MSALRLPVSPLLLALTLLLAGCGSPSDDAGGDDNGPGGSATDDRDVRIFDAGRFDGAVNRHWEVEFNDTSFRTFLISLEYLYVDGGGADGADGFNFKNYHLEYKRGDGTCALCDNRADYTRTFDADNPGDTSERAVFYRPLPGGTPPPPTGLWTIDLSATDSMAEFELTIELDY